MTWRTAWTGLALVLGACGGSAESAAPGGGRGASADTVAVPVRIGAGDVVRYRLDWEQQSTSGPHDSGAATWHAEFELRGLDAVGGAAQAELLQFVAYSRAETRRATLRFAPDGTVADAGELALPVGFAVTAHGVAGTELVTPRDWAQTFVRALPTPDVRSGATWDFPALFDGLPVPLRVTFHARVESIDDAQVVVAAEGDVHPPQLDASGADVATWLAEATRSAHARVVVSRRDGLVEELEMELVLDAPRHWQDAPDAAAPRTHHARNHTRFVRVR